MSQSLYDLTKQRLASKPDGLSLTQLAKEAGLKAAWLTAFNRGEIPDPGVIKVQKLHDALERLGGENV